MARTPRLLGFSASVAIFAAFAAAELACTPQQAAIVSSVIDVVGCVADHQSEPDPQVVAECVRDNVTVEDVLQILARQRRATDRARAAACVPDGGR